MARYVECYQFLRRKGTAARRAAAREKNRALNVPGILGLGSWVLSRTARLLALGPWLVALGSVALGLCSYCSLALGSKAKARSDRIGGCAGR